MPPSPKDLRILYQKSGNRCAFPGCPKTLVHNSEGADDHVVLSEVAHIVAQSPDGPRGDHPLPMPRRDRYDNLILLCEEHHTIVDTQVHTYTVERLHQMKADHEALIAQATWQAVAARGGDPGELARVRETVYSTLLPVLRMPRYVYGVPCEFNDSQEKLAAKEIQRPEDPAEMCPFIIREGMLYCFQNLRYAQGPFRMFVGRQRVRRYEAGEWWDDADRMRWFINLLNRSLNKLTGRKNLYLDKRHHRYFFQSAEKGRPMEVTYRPLNQSKSSRNVVWQPVSARTGEARPYWYHLAVALKFHRVSDEKWCLSIRPEMYVSKDGVVSLDSDEIGGRVTHKKSRMFNYDLLGEIQFWRDYLSGSQPRILLPFGKGQHVVVGTSLMQGEVEWPGIPEQYARPFKNVEYDEDLFTLAEMGHLNSEALEEADDFEDGDEDEEEF